MFFGAILALTLCNAGEIVRRDGSRVILMKNPTWQSELWGLWETLRFEPFVVLLFPMFFVSNWFYVYQQNAVNGAYFNTRTKALNSLLYWMAQIIAAAIWGYLLDRENVRRSTRAKAAWAALFVLTFAIWGGGYAFEKTYTRESVAPETDFVHADWTDSNYVGLMFLYIFYGFYDAAWQATIYWYVTSPLSYTQLLTDQVHGSPLQLWSTICQLRRLLQGYPVRWCRDRQQPRLPQDLFPIRVHQQLGSACSVPCLRCSRHSHEDSRPREH